VCLLLLFKRCVYTFAQDMKLELNGVEW